MLLTFDADHDEVKDHRERRDQQRQKREVLEKGGEIGPRLARIEQVAELAREIFHLRSAAWRTATVRAPVSRSASYRPRDRQARTGFLRASTSRGPASCRTPDGGRARC